MFLLVPALNDFGFPLMLPKVTETSEDVPAEQISCFWIAVEGPLETTKSVCAWSFSVQYSTLLRAYSLSPHSGIHNSTSEQLCNAAMENRGISHAHAFQLQYRTVSPDQIGSTWWPGSTTQIRCPSVCDQSDLPMGCSGLFVPRMCSCETQYLFERERDWELLKSHGIQLRCRSWSRQ